MPFQPILKFVLLIFVLISLSNANPSFERKFNQVKTLAKIRSNSIMNLPNEKKDSSKTYKIYLFNFILIN